ncbi:MAG: F0F1 ATP synthase subunit A [Deltaproteobacteria bacterium]|nr:F0F1 ATP synthase subunit A [Deltaproteobacteria bacterium]
MPHGQSIFNYLPGYENLVHALELLYGSTFGGSGAPSFYQHVPLRQTEQGVNHIFGLLLVLLICVVFGLVVRSKIANMQAALVPDGKLTIRNFVELFVGAFYGLMKDIMGEHEARFFLPLIGTCAFIIFFSNAMGLVPGMPSATTNLNTTLACGVVVFFATHIFGVVRHGPKYFAHFLGPIIKWYALPLMLLMLVIELISHFVRPLSLALRLLANMSADHMVVGIFLGLIPLFVPLPVMLLGCMVVAVQTLVFCVLSTVYISMAVAHEEH